jgi:hypothetical protein
LLKNESCKPFVVSLSNHEPRKSAVLRRLIAFGDQPGRADFQMAQYFNNLLADGATRLPSPRVELAR